MTLGTIDDIENCMENGWSDGLPVIPPYASLVEPMLAAMGWSSPSEVIGAIPEQKIEIRAEHAAATAVMAGCKPAWGKLLRTLTLALLDPRFNITAVEVTTGGPGVLVIVSGPIVAEYGFEHESNAYGANKRVNATIGRYAQMIRHFCGSGGGVLQAMGTIGHPGRISYCIAEHPDTTWAPYHTQWGLPAEASAVTIMAAEAPNSVNNHYAESGALVLETISDTLAHFGSTSFYWRYSGYLIGLARDHMALISKEFSREQARRFVYEHAQRPTDELKRVGRIPRTPLEGQKVEFGKPRSPMSAETQLTFIECGGAGGRFSAVIPRWAGNFNAFSTVIE
jgi:hypothetical protein